MVKKKTLLDRIIYEPFPENQYYKRAEAKTQVVLHHTVSGKGLEGDLNWWLSTPQRIATAFIIGRDGTIHQNFSSKYWAHHLGVKSKVFEAHDIPLKGNNVWLNIKSIGIELDSWGGLKEGDLQKVDGFVEHYPNKYRGYEYFETYTPKQVSSLRELLVYLCDKYNIPVGYNDDMWDVSKNALEGTPGIWSHTSFRKDKSDCHPQESLIKMLKRL